MRGYNKMTWCGTEIAAQREICSVRKSESGERKGKGAKATKKRKECKDKNQCLIT